MAATEKDVVILRELAQKYMGYASLPVQEEKRSLWISLNNLNMQKPMVCIDQMPWNELDVDGSLLCQVQDPYFRHVENWLRQLIYKWEHLPVDMVLEPYILIPRLIGNTGYGIDILEETINYDPTSHVHSHTYTNQFEELEDIEKIKTPQISVDRNGEQEKMQEALRIFEGIAPVKFSGEIVHLGLWDKVSTLMGVENCYIELLDRPELLHAVMDRFTSATISMVEQLNQLGLYDVNSHMCHCSYTYDGKLPTGNCDLDNPTSRDGWAFGLAQLFTAVSPEITAEFEVPYMQRLFPYFGAIYYGCCEGLDDRLDIISRMPNIRKVSCSPWSDRDHFAEVLPKNYVMSNKPTPALLAGPSFDEDAVRADLRHTIRAARTHGVALEMILKDISTVCYQPQRLWRWAEIAAEETLRAAEA